MRRDRVIAPSRKFGADPSCMLREDVVVAVDRLERPMTESELLADVAQERRPGDPIA